MPYDWTRLQEGDAITAASLNTPFAAVRGELNGLESLSVAPFGLHRDHLPSTVLAAERAVINPGSNHTYDSTSEPYPGYGVNAGWRVVNTNGSAGTGTQLAVAFAPAVNLANTSLVGGILVLANVHVITMEYHISGTGVLTNQASLMLVIQYEISGTWYTLARSERFLSPATDYDDTGQLAILKDAPIRTYLTFADVQGKGDEQVTGIRVATSVNSTGLLVDAYLREGNLTAIAVRAGVL